MNHFGKLEKASHFFCGFNLLILSSDFTYVPLTYAVNYTIINKVQEV